MNFIMDIIRVIGAIFDLMLAVPIFGVLALATLFVPVIVKAFRRR